MNDKEKAELFERILINFRDYEKWKNPKAKDRIVKLWNALDEYVYVTRNYFEGQSEAEYKGLILFYLKKLESILNETPQEDVNLDYSNIKGK